MTNLAPVACPHGRKSVHACKVVQFRATTTENGKVDDGLHVPGKKLAYQQCITGSNEKMNLCGVS